MAAEDGVKGAKRRRQNEGVAADEGAAPQVEDAIITLHGPDGEQVGPPLKVPLASGPDNLEVLVNSLLDQADEPRPYAFFIDAGSAAASASATSTRGSEIPLGGGDGAATLGEHLARHGVSLERLDVTFRPQAWFKVLPVSRCSASMEGHSESVLCASFSPSGNQLASGSGDTTVRLWDLHTQTPLRECRRHTDWVTALAWAPDNGAVASGAMDGLVCIWDPDPAAPSSSKEGDGGESGKGGGLGADGPRLSMRGHTECVTALAWEPAHLPGALPSRRVCSSSRDKSLRVWDAVTGRCLFSLHGHKAPVTCVRWGGAETPEKGALFSSSRDCNINVWDPSRGTLLRQLRGHAHWVNTLALSTEHALRTGFFVTASHVGGAHKREAILPPPRNPAEATPEQWEALRLQALAQYEAARGGQPERLVSGSDDFTMFLWEPTGPGCSKKPIARMSGHKNLVNEARFSPDGQFIASASFDKSVKLWRASNGAFVCSFFGHVGPVYQVAWSADSRLLCSGSKDSTLKLWCVRTKKLKGDLPGHADEVFAVDWSESGTFVASGGRDRVLKLWRH